MLILVKVKLKQKQTQIKKIDDQSTNFPLFKIHLRSAPVRGQANAELIALLANYFSKPQSAFKIKRGLTSTTKLISIT